MKKFKFNKPLVESHTAPKDINTYWVDVDESTGKVSTVKEYNKGDWQTVLKDTLVKPLPSGPENREIHYTTSDGNIVEPNVYTADYSQTPGFGATIISNTYENGQGIIKFDGIVTRIPYSAFWSCGSLISITIPNSVTSIGNSAFNGCSKLTSISIPNNVTNIGEAAFKACSSLTSIIIGKGITGIRNQTFSDCNSLKFIDIPNNVAFIDVGAFAYSSNLSDIYLNSTPALEMGSFLGLTPGLKIHYNNQIYELWTNVTIPLLNGTKITLSSLAPCFAEGTKITLADGSYKNIEDLTYDDELKVWNFDEGKEDTAKPLWLMKAIKADCYQLIKFEDGNELKVIGDDFKCHRMFDYDEMKFNHAVDCVGHRVYTDNGVTKVLSITKVEEFVNRYNLYTNKHINCYANDVLTSCNYSNIYPIEDMQYVKDNRALVDYSVYEALGISLTWYEGMRLGEQTIPVEETVKYIKDKIHFLK